MISIREFWRRHRRKVVVSFGVVGGSYFLYKLYEAHKSRLVELETQLANDRENDEVIESQLKAHFENIQRIADTTTLPHAVELLNTRLADELNLAPLTDRLMQGKGQSNSLTPQEKLELWDRLKILSFTRTAVSVWALTMSSLYIRVQVNILARHLYLDIARAHGSSTTHDDGDTVRRQGEQQYLETSDFLSTSALPALINSVQTAASEILKGLVQCYFIEICCLEKLVKCSAAQILDMFMGTGKPHHWLNYLTQGLVGSHESYQTSLNEHNASPDVRKFESLMEETRAVLSSSEFENVIEISLVTLVSALMEDMAFQLVEGSSTSPGIPLAKVLPKIVLMGPMLLQEGTRYRYKIPEVERFFTLLYANTPVV